ncbi:LysR family transcriptional regulator [Duganella aceris]|jgi:DNA-binding transcriptional LysR family regulator|uniref:LysR family transcriptional regulator n=1 Tax=Duganella aceris TaxID=2703883 RepID=A0ABX0FFM2_9BURK|nr:LysR family transcriptional regulator [Duganella aceris]NGZ83349.1 LysR family transcriptional regulator [Duganella aceris]
MNDRFQELMVFVRAADTGSFSATARDLGLSQPSVSRIVSELETRLGIKLLLRSTRRIVPTEAGVAFLRKARQILYDLEDADESARGIDSLRGVLRVALPSVLCIKILIPGLPLFLKDHPQLKIEFLTSDNMQDLVADGVDVAIRFGKMSDSGFGARKLASLERMLVASPAYLAERGAPQAPAELAQHDLIVGPLVAANWPWSFERDGKTDTIKVEPRFLLNSAEAAIASACHGLGLARAATLMCRDELASGQLVPALPGYKLEPVDLHAVYPAGRTPSQKVRLFTSFLSQLL